MSKINYSIIIPHKNIPVLLSRCLNSIPYRDDVEIIIVDDNSDPAIVDFNVFPGLQDSRCKIIYSKEEGKGAGYARNKALEIAKGKWLLFSDSDDFFSEDINSLMDEYLNDDSDIIYFNVDSVMSDDVTKKAKRSKKRLFEKFSRNAADCEMAFRYEYTEPWGKVIRKSLIDKYSIRFDEVIVSNDSFFSVKTGYYASSIKIDDRCLYIVTCRPESLSYNFAPTLDKLDIRIGVALNVHKFLLDHNVHIKISPLRGLMVIALKRSFVYFIKKLVYISSQMNPFPIIYQMFNPKYFN